MSSSGNAALFGWFKVPIFDYNAALDSLDVIPQ
jgi:hypothetical protein